MSTPARSAEWMPAVTFMYVRTTPIIPKTDQVVDMRHKSLALGSEIFFWTVSAAKRLSTALRSWKLETMVGDDELPESLVEDN
jgi:hypothetical protein